LIKVTQKWIITNIYICRYDNAGQCIFVKCVIPDRGNAVGNSNGGQVRILKGFCTDSLNGLSPNLRGNLVRPAFITQDGSVAVGLKITFRVLGDQPKYQDPAENSRGFSQKAVENPAGFCPCAFGNLIFGIFEALHNSYVSVIIVTEK
jgi:hypothetical protein